ncbi:MAG: hypothetical protein QM817_01785 [Archangium sp.]
MGFVEKNTLLFLITSVLGSLSYAITILMRARDVALTQVAYVGPMLITIGAAIAVGIVGNALISFSNREEAGQKDLRDEQISRFGTNIGQAFIVIGGVSALLLSMYEVSHFWISQALYFGFVLSAVVGSSAQLVAYRKGLPQ